jgi:hypothetical protein
MAADQAPAAARQRRRQVMRQAGSRGRSWRRWLGALLARGATWDQEWGITPGAALGVGWPAAGSALEVFVSVPRRRGLALLDYKSHLGSGLRVSAAVRPAAIQVRPSSGLLVLVLMVTTLRDVAAAATVIAVGLGPCCRASYPAPSDHPLLTSTPPCAGRAARGPRR